MNDTSAVSQSGASLLPDGIGALTAVHLVVVALVAIAAIAIILFGSRRKRARLRAEHEVTRNAEQAGVAAPSAEPERVTEAPAPPPPPAPPRDEASASLPAPTPLDDEPIAAAAPLDASPASEASPPEPTPSLPTSSSPTSSPIATPAVGGAPGDQPVTLLKGLGPKVSAALAAHGITNVGQLAALTEADAAALDAELGAFRGRMARDRWIEQARFLAAGDRAGFEAAFGKL